MRISEYYDNGLCKDFYQKITIVTTALNEYIKKSSEGSMRSISGIESNINTAMHSTQQTFTHISSLLSKNYTNNHYKIGSILLGLHIAMSSTSIVLTILEDILDKEIITDYLIPIFYIANGLASLATHIYWWGENSKSITFSNLRKVVDHKYFLTHLEEIIASLPNYKNILEHSDTDDVYDYKEEIEKILIVDLLLMLDTKEATQWPINNKIKNDLWDIKYQNFTKRSFFSHVDELRSKLMIYGQGAPEANNTHIIRSIQSVSVRTASMLLLSIIAFIIRLVKSDNFDEKFFYILTSMIFAGHISLSLIEDIYIIRDTYELSKQDVPRKLSVVPNHVLCTLNQCLYDRITLLLKSIRCLENRCYLPLHLDPSAEADKNIVKEFSDKHAYDAVDDRYATNIYEETNQIYDSVSSTTQEYEVMRPSTSNREVTH